MRNDDLEYDLSALVENEGLELETALFVLNGLEFVSRAVVEERLALWEREREGRP